MRQYCNSSRRWHLRPELRAIVLLLCLLQVLPVKADRILVSLDLQNPQRSEYDALKAYMITLRRAIQENWLQSAPHKGSPLLKFSINPDGKLADIEVKKCGGDRNDDDAALNAVSQCFPFELPPRGFQKSLLIEASFKPLDTNLPQQPSGMNQLIRNATSKASNAIRGWQYGNIRPISLPVPAYTYSYGQWTPYAPPGYSPYANYPYVPNSSVQNIPAFPPAYVNPYGQGFYSRLPPSTYGGNYNFQNPYGRTYQPPQVSVSPYQQDNTAFAMNAAYQSILKADALVKHHQTDEAIEVLDQARQFDPNRNSACIHGRLANLLCEQNRPEEALNEYRTMYKLEPHSAGAELGIASCYQRLGKLQAAVGALEKFLSDHPGDRQTETVNRELISLRTADQSWLSSDPNSSDYLDCEIAKGLYRWSKDRFPLKMFFSPATGVRGYHATYNSWLFNAVNTWLEATGQSLQCVTCDSEDQADIVCKWSDDRKEVAGMEQGLTTPSLTKTSATDAEWQIGKVSIEIWTVDATGRSIADPSFIKAACMHEAGHALGLSHSPNNEDVMFFQSSKTTGQCLSERDRNTIAKLYSTALAASQN
jgi:TonB family protein